MRQRPSQTVQFPDDQAIAAPQVGQARLYAANLRLQTVTNFTFNCSDVRNERNLTFKRSATPIARWKARPNSDRNGQSSPMKLSLHPRTFLDAAVVGFLAVGLLTGADALEGRCPARPTELGAVPDFHPELGASSNCGSEVNTI